VWNDSAAAGFLPLLPDGHTLPEIEPGLFAELLATPELSVLVAEQNDEVVGYAGSGASRDSDAGPEAGEVRSLFVASASWRSGVGRALMDAALADLRGRGYSEAIVWSFAANDRANAFYESCGFKRDGAERTEERFADIPSVRYRRSL
jgi:ribosomal protein S18 acetylase RimI-like enzyme